MFASLRRVPRYDDARESTWGLVRFDTAKCSGCNLCVQVCPSDVLVLEGGKARMRTTGVVQCMACGDCTAICPDAAIELFQSYRFTGAYETLDRRELRPPRL